MLYPIRTTKLISANLAAIGFKKRFLANLSLRNVEEKLFSLRSSTDSPVPNLRFKSSAANDRLVFSENNDIATSESALSDFSPQNWNSSQEHAWKVNLGRGSNNKWLTGARSDDWFTGLSPKSCPGKHAVNFTLGEARRNCGWQFSVV
jgi:hypothetical protein